MVRDEEAPARSGGAPTGYTITELAWPACSGVIGLASCPGVRAGRFRPELLARDLDETQRWGAAAMVCLIVEDEVEGLPLERLIYEVRRRGMGCVQLRATGQGHDMDLQSDWSRVRGRAVRALRNGERLLIPCTEGPGRSGLVVAWLMIEGGASPEDALAAIRAAYPGAFDTADQEASVRSYAPQA